MAKTKCYVLDTNIIMRNPEVLNGFADNEVVLPEIVQRELDYLKDAPGQKGFDARNAVNAIDNFYTRKDGDPERGWKTTGGGIFRIERRRGDKFLYSHLQTKYTADDLIIAVALMLQAENGKKKPTILVSADRNMRHLAINAGLTAESYKNDEVKDTSFSFKGWEEIDTSDSSIIDTLYADGTANIDGNSVKVLNNEYLIVKDGSKSVLARFRNGALEKLHKIPNSGIYGVKPRNARQTFQLDACLAPAEELPLVIVRGAAGTGKTYLALAAGLDALFDNKYEKVIITRSMTTPEGEGELGILPGDTKDKMDPYLAPFYDNIIQIFRQGEKKEDPEQLRIQIDDMILQGQIEIQPMSAIRGRSFVNSYIIIDEAQNTTAKQIETLITRLGEGSKLCILGDPNQIDTSKLSRYSNGLAVASEKMRGSSLVAEIEYADCDIQRSPLAKEAVARFSAPL